MEKTVLGPQEFRRNATSIAFGLEREGFSGNIQKAFGFSELGSNMA